LAHVLGNFVNSISNAALTNTKVMSHLNYAAYYHVTEKRIQHVWLISCFAGRWLHCMTGVSTGFRMYVVAYALASPRKVPMLCPPSENFCVRHWL